MQAVLMVEINRLYRLWWRYSDRSSYGGDKQTVPAMVEIFGPFLLWWR